VFKCRCFPIEIILAFKRVIRSARGFQTMKTAAATLKGFEVMRMIRRGDLPSA
jgi:hypothetical protein